MTDTLPVGTHPGDRRASPTDFAGVTPPVPAPPARSGRPPFPTANGRAMPVFQRADRTWNGEAIRVPATPVCIAQRRKGRGTITVSVPSSVVIAGVVVTVTAGVLVAATAGEASMFKGLTLNKGDSVTIASEGSFYAISLPGSSAGIVQVIETYNPPEKAPGT